MHPPTIKRESTTQHREIRFETIVPIKPIIFPISGDIVGGTSGTVFWGELQWSKTIKDITP
jgi:hypothetical protein